MGAGISGGIAYRAAGGLGLCGQILAWSSAWAYRAGGEELVVRFGPEVSWYEADRMAVAFGGPDLPVPQVKEVGLTASGRAYAISVRHHGRFVEDTPAEQAGALAPALTRLLVALYRVPAGPDTPVIWHRPGGPAVSWRQFLLAALADDPGNLVHGDLLSGLLQDPGVRAGPGALRDAAARHHCYELHIGFTHLGWNVWTGNPAKLPLPPCDQCSTRPTRVFPPGRYAGNHDSPADRDDP